MLGALSDAPGPAHVLRVSHEEEPSMSHYGAEVREELRPHARELRRAIPDVYKGFAALHEAALTEGVLSTKIKELIALALATSQQCDGCIAAHAHGAVEHGATPDEAAEALGVVFLMNGGPATIYGPRAFAAFREFYDAKQSATPD
jgi:AhpD family alkylhydroperoxidase